MGNGRGDRSKRGRAKTLLRSVRRFAAAWTTAYLTLDLSNAEATFKVQLDKTLDGTAFGVDFNPVPDRLRIVSNTGQNLRANVDNGVTAVDGGLTYMPGPPPVPALGITGAAYTNNDADANTATTLFDIDSTLDQVAIQAPPNSGTLNPTGKLGVDTASAVGFDIYSRLSGGPTTLSVHAFASLTTALLQHQPLHRRGLSSGDVPRATRSSTSRCP